MQLFLDCDGVLADFDTAAHQLLGVPPRLFEEQHGSRKFWTRIYAHGSFYRDLPLMPDAMELYDAVRHLRPVILTGCPRGEWSQQVKREWIAEHFPECDAILCRSADKSDHMRPGDVIIDDWPQHRQKWIDRGGIWIDHISARQSLRELWNHYPDLEG